MSEYQHYEFHAIDRPLNADEMTAVGSMSSRVQLSARKAVFTYSYGSFRYDEEEVLVDYFDFLLYMANWGTKRLMMKFPLDLVDYDFLKKYRISVLADYEQDIRILKREEYVIVDISYHEEDGLGWIDEDAYAYDFLNIRSEIMKGDYRSLFVIWLRFLEGLHKSNDFDPDYSIDSKLIPLNLLHLSSSGHAAKEFYQVNDDWLNVMRSYSNKGAEGVANYQALIPSMSKARMTEYLRMILSDEPNLQIRLIKELKGQQEDQKNEFGQIKLSVIGEKVTGIVEARSRAKEKKRARTIAKRMENLRQSKDQVERAIKENIEQGNSKSYKLAVSKIVELKAMNDYFQMGSYFEVFINQISADYSRKSSFIRMLKNQELME